MLHFSKAKIWMIAAVCALGVLFSLPNFISPGTLPSWVPQHRINLGLDLQGGSYLLLEVDMDTVIRERLEGALDTTRTALRTANIRYTDLAVRDRAVTFTLNDASQSEAARAALGDLLGASVSQTQRDFSFSNDGPRVQVALTERGITDRAARAVEQSIEIVRRRIDETGVNEPVIARQGSNRILVQLPGVTDPDRIKRLLGQTAKMTFHLLGDETAARGSAAPPGTQWLPSIDPASRGQQYLVRKKIEVDGASLLDARPGADQRNGTWVVNFEFDSAGARRFAEITKANVGRPFAIVLDGKVISAPVIREPITGGRGQISGNFTTQSANDLAVLLRAGALPAPLTIVEERTIGPDLGADSIRAGILACLVGFVLVVSYMIISYGLFGVYANIALIFNLFLTIAALSLLNATLTLPGIAGLLLTLGMSVDANILINERIREESRKGRSAFAAMEAGFTRAFATIVDANLTTLIKMVLLYAVGTGTIRGFAVTISLGIITSMFTATIVTRLLMVTWLKKHRPKVLSVTTGFRLAPDDTKIRFMRGKRLGLIFSVLLSLASIGLFIKPGLNYGVDFAGGIVMEIRTPDAAELPRTA